MGRRGWSGKLKNLGKPFFLTLATDAVQDMNQEQDHYGMTHARKAMIRCGLLLDVDGYGGVNNLPSGDNSRASKLISR